MTDKPNGKLRLSSYNIRKAVGTDRRRDPHRILGILSDLETDIAVLQEADRRLGPRPSALPLSDIAHRTGLQIVNCAKNRISCGWHGNAILIRPEVKIECVELLHLPGIEPRGAVIADLDLGHRPLRVAGVHLGLLRSSRRLQLTALLEHLRTMSDRPTIIAGDFNEWSQKAGLGRLAPHFSIHAPGKTYHAKRPVAALDRIALDDRLKLIEAGVLDTPVTRVASDHLPIWTEFAFRD